MTWLTEQPLVIVFVAVVIEALLLVALVQTARRAILYAMIAVALLCGGLVLAERLIVTPREAVRATLFQIAADLESNDLTAVLAHISPRGAEIRADAERILPGLVVHEVNIKRNLKITVRQESSPPRADATFNATFVVTDVGGTAKNLRVPRRFTLTFRHENGRWLLRSYEMESPFGRR